MKSLLPTKQAAYPSLAHGFLPNVSLVDVLKSKWVSYYECLLSDYLLWELFD